MVHKKIAIALVLLSVNYVASAFFWVNHRKGHDLLSLAGRTRRLDVVTAAEEQEAKTDALPSKYGPFYMDMPLDHFAKNKSVTFQNRYWINADYYKKDGPIILANAGEAAVDDAAYTLTNTTMIQLAQKLNGIFIYMEHRFYGSSGPAATNFDYAANVISKLNTDQALADMAYILKNVKFSGLDVPAVPKTKAIVYGCSYSGNLAAWMKEQYPELVYAAVASSAPVQAQFNFYQYFDPIIRYGPTQCISAIEHVITYIDKILFGSSSKAVKELKELFGVPELYDDDFASYLTTAIATYWQYGVELGDNRFDQVICNKVFNGTSVEDNVKSFAVFNKNYVEKNTCDGYSSISACLGSHNATDVQEQLASSPSTAAWTWQTCTEYGYFQVAAPKNNPTIVSRKLGIEVFERMCQLFFTKVGIPKKPNTAKVNKKYKGWNAKLDRIVWIDGEYDSWRELSVHSPQVKRNFSKNKQTLSIIIPEATHCVNWAGVNSKTPQYLKDIQDQQYKTLKRWLDQA